MKINVYLVMIFILILVGCSIKSTSEGLVAYDKEKVVNSLNDLSFSPEIPSLLPFEPIETKVDVMDLGGMENSLLSVLFINEKQEEITFKAGKVENTFDFTEEKLKILDGLDGKYGDKDNAKTLKWEKDGISYELFVDSDSFSKEEALDIARSFNQIN